jgi:hypothetical protein
MGRRVFLGAIVALAGLRLRRPARVAFPPCDTCGAESVMVRADLREVQATPAPDGQMWEEWRPTGHWRNGCTLHPVESKMVHLDGRVVWVPWSR